MSPAAQVRARDLGMVSIGAGNSTSFAPTVHAEPEGNIGDTAPLSAEPLDPAQQERLDAFLTSSRNSTVTCDRLDFLNISYSIPERLKSGSFNCAGGSVVLTPQNWVITRQGRIEKTRVLEYVEMIRNGDDMADIQVTDIVPGGGHWHLNGLHRLTASRILGVDVKASIWR